jgi:hypothetical protein
VSFLASPHLGHLHSVRTAFIVSDDAPDLDIDAAIDTIVARAGDPSAPRVTINRVQQEAVVEALRAKYPLAGS